MSRSVALFALWCSLAAWGFYLISSRNPPGPQSASPEPPKDCLALGFGTWMPRRPDWLPRSWWREPPHLRLLPRLEGSVNGEGWFSVGFAPTGDSTSKPTRTSRAVRVAEFLWVWRAPTSDSLQLIRFAFLSVGLSVAGRWDSDTLRGRVHGFSDVFAPDDDPCANAYAVRYNCVAPRADQLAPQALRAFLNVDRPDMKKNAAEADAEEARWDSTFQRKS